ncbi:copper resistance D family protein [Lentzea sp. NPDC059081]|uniref:copper resistance D family protein n=1 Tax=Lentzea sp. NPDC059081 TaxID=3346719 RepID=UPI00368204C8
MTVTRLSGRAPSSFLGLVIAAGCVSGVLVGLGMSVVSAAPGLVEPATAVRIGLPLARMAIMLAAVVVVGAALLPFLVGTRRRAASRVAVVGSAVWVVAALACLVLDIATVHVGHQITGEMIVWHITGFRTGTALALVMAGAVVNLVVAAVAVRRDVPVLLPLVIATFTVLPLPPSGHSFDAPDGVLALGVLGLELHVLAVTAWTGGLLAVAIAAGAQRELLADALPRFSRLATVCIFVAAIAGVVSGVLHLVVSPDVQWFSALFTTTYGRILVLKGVLLTAAGLLGAHIRFRLLSSIRAQRPTAFVRWAALELAVMGLAFGLAAVLARSPVDAI